MLDESREMTHIYWDRTYIMSLFMRRDAALPVIALTDVCIAIMRDRHLHIHVIQRTTSMCHLSIPIFVNDYVRTAVMRDNIVSLFLLLLYNIL